MSSILRYTTAGESHGKCLTAILEGIPAGLPLSEEEINRELQRRQYAFGRGERLQYIEQDKVSITSGVRWGETLGSPICMNIANRDYENWETIMSLEEKDRDEKFALRRPRPGHADLAGALKYDRKDTRDILERASARETAARVAAGAICKKLLAEFGIRIVSFVKQVGEIRAKAFNYGPGEITKIAEASPLRCLDKEAEKKMIQAILDAKEAGDTIGGIYSVVCYGVPPGLGSHTQWDLKLDARLAAAVMSIQAHKGVEIGRGFDMARRRGSEVHDEIFYQPVMDNATVEDLGWETGSPRPWGFYRKSNNAGGIEGGMTNGEPIIVHAAVKPLASLRRPLASVNLATKEVMKAEIIRSDICPVASAAVIGEHVVAIEIARAMREKFGGDSLAEMKRNFEAYLEHLRNW